MNLYGNYAREKENQVQSNLAYLGRYTQALLDTNPDTAFNPFGDGSHTNPATLNSIRTSNQFHVDSQLRTADVTLDGPIAHLPGGDLKLALGADHRNQTYATVTRQVSSPVNIVSVDDQRNVTAAVGEIRIPLFGKDNGRWGFKRLELSVAGRYETYSDFGDATTPKLGIAWSPLEALSLRGTWGRSIRAPTLAELDTRNNYIVPFEVADATSSTRFAQVLVQTGKEPHLTVERARTWTAGLDLDASRWVAGLTFSATYFNIVFRDRIEEPTLAVGILDDPNYSSIVTRNPTTTELAVACSQGIYASRGGESCTQSGPQAILDLRSRNLTGVSTSGIDLNASYERSWSPGTLRLRLDGTYLQDFTEHTTATAPAIQLLNTQNNPINLKLRGLLSWQQRLWGAALGINFQNHYTDTISAPNRNIASYTTCDLQLRYAPPVFGASVLQNTLVELNAVNVFNRSPPFLNNATAHLGYDQENADPYGRMLSVQVRKSW
jgi:outer membrane receptor protein involved in Fe transport